MEVGSQWEFDGWLRELKPGLRDSLNGYEEVGGGREVLRGRRHIHTYGRFMLVYDNTVL